MSRLTSATLLWFSFLTLPATAAVTGVVITPEGAPVADARVQAFSPEDSSERRQRILAGTERETLASATTDAKGAFSLNLKNAPSAEVLFERVGHAPVTVRATAEDDLGATVLRPAPLRTGTIRAGGEPVPGATIILSARDGSELTVRTNEKGEYAVPDPDAWGESMLVLHPDFARLEVERRFPAKWQMDHRLSAGSSYSGRVVSADGKTPIEGARILVDEWPAATSVEDGGFTIAHMPESWKEIRAIKGDQVASHPRTSSGAILRLGKASKVSGVVTDGAGRAALGGVRVSLGRESREWTVSDSRGNFAFSSLSPGTYWLVASMPGFIDSRIEVPVGPAAAESRSIALARTGSIEGVVLDENGKGVAGASLEANPNPAGSFRPPRRIYPFAYSGPDGRFVIRNVPPTNELALEASRKGFAETRHSGVKVAAGEKTRGLRVTLPSGFEIAGRVANRDGGPIAGATIQATKSTPGNRPMRPFMFDPDAPELPATGTDGQFALRLAEGSYDLEVRAEGYAPKRVLTVRVARGSEPLEIVLEEGMRLAGRVVTASGAPVADATLMLATMEAGPQGRSVSSSDGSFAFEDLSPGKMMLSVQKLEAFVMFTQPVTVPDSQVIVQLPPGGNVSGRVIDKQTKRPVTAFSAGLSGLRTAGGAMRGGPPMMKEFRSDDGTFLLENLPVGQHQIQVSAPGYATATLSGVTVDESTPVEDLEVNLEAGVRIAGTVTGSDGASLSGVRVMLEDPGGRPPMGPPTMQTSDADGRYAIENIPAGEITLRFFKEGFVTETRTVKLAGPETRVDVRLGTGIDVTGTVVDASGRPVGEATVMIQGSGSGGRGTSDGNGAFKVDGIAPGRYTIRATKTGFAPAVLRDVDVASAGPLRLVLESGGTIYGRVTGHNESDEVTVRATSNEGFAASSVDAAGNYRIEGAPVGTVTVTAGYRLSSGPSKQIEVSSGGSYAVDLEFRDDVVITGRVSRGGRPAGLSMVMFNPSDPRIRTRGMSSTDAEGVYTVSGLEPGEYNVRVMDNNTMQSYDTTYRVTGSANFDIDVRGATLRGRVVDAESGDPVADVPITVSQEGSTSPARGFPSTISGWDGNFAIENVDEGTYQVRAQKAGWGHGIQTVSVGNGFAEEVIFRLTKNDGMLIRVVDGRDGKALSAGLLVTDAANRVVYQGQGVRQAEGGTRISVAPGTYRVTVSSGGYAPRTITVAAPGESSVALTPGGTIIVTVSGSERVLARIVSSSGEPYRRNAWSLNADFPLDPGTTPLAHVTPGAYTVMILDASGRPVNTQSVTVVEGQSVEVKF